MKLDDIKAEIKKTRAYQWAESRKNKAASWLKNNPTGQKVEAGYRKTAFMAREAYGKLPQGVRNGFGKIGAELKGFTSGAIGKVFAGFGVVEILKAHGVLGKMKETVKQLWMMTVGWKLQMAQAFFTGKSFLAGMIRGTGSLEAALNRIGKMQTLAHVFAPFLGGLAAGKRKVAEIFALAAKSPFNVDQWAHASRAMTVGSHGALGNTQELQAVGDAAAATGNDVGDVGEAVAEFYAAVRDGRPVGELTEKMRQMGIVTEGSAESLKTLAENGTDAASMSRELMGALSVNAGAMEALKGELQGVTKAYDDAKRGLKEKFGAPVTEVEIQGLKNYTDVMLALAPAVGRLSQFFQNMAGAFSNFWSGLAKSVAQNDALVGSLEVLVKLLGIGLGVVSLTAVLWLGKLAVSFGAARAAAWLLSAAMQGMMRWTVIIGIVAILADKYFHLTDAIFGTKTAAEREADAHDKARRAIQSKINAVETLTQKQEALKAMTDEALKAEEELAGRTDKDGKHTAGLDEDAAKEAEANKTKPVKGALASGLAGAAAAAMTVPGRLKIPAAVVGFVGGLIYGAKTSKPDTVAANAQKEAQGRRDLNREAARKLAAKGGLVGAAEQRQMESDLATSRATESASLRLREAQGENGMVISLEDLQTTKKRASAAQSGLSASTAAEKKRDEDEAEFQRLRLAHASPAELNAVEARKANRGMEGGYGSAYAASMVEKLNAAKEAGNDTLSDEDKAKHLAVAGGVKANAQELEWWRKETMRLKEQEGNAPQLTASVMDKTADILGKMQPVASNLARIGGGGNVSGPLDQIPRDQLATLREILATLKGGDPTSPESASPDVSRPPL